MDSRRTLAAIAVVLAVLLVAAAVAVPAVFRAQRANNTTSNYYYSAEVSTNATLTNATLYLPLPLDPDGTPLVESARVTGPDGEPVDWTTRVVETPRGPMLAVETDEVVGEELYYLRNENGSPARPDPITRGEAPDDMTGLFLDPSLTRYEIRAEVTVESFGYGIANGTIETRYPRGNSSLLSATYDYEPGECEPVWGGAEQTCTAFQSDVYASYETKPSAIVRVGAVELWGLNEWGWFFANSFNEYTQRVEQVSFTGPHDGWANVAGELQAGKGSYG
jgi:hypothetical protein